MAFKKILFGFALLGLMVAGCDKQDAVKPMQQDVSQQTLQDVCDCEIRYGDGSFGDGSLSNARTESAVSITSVTAPNNVLITFRRFPNVSFLPIDTDGQDVLTISGSGFGATRGTGSVSFSGLSSYFVTGIDSWSNTQIRVRVRSSYNSVPAPSSLNNNETPNIVVTTNAGTTASRNIRVAPRITTKQWGQCTWWANKRRGETGRTVQARGAAYSNYSGTVNANYVPQAGHILIWHNQHQAFVESVTVTTGAWVNNQRSITYRIYVTEYNGHSETYHERTYDVTIREKRAANGSVSRSIQSGAFRSALYASSATNFFR